MNENNEKIEKQSSFKRIETVFNNEIPDRVPKFEMVIDLSENSKNPEGLIIGTYSPQMINIIKAQILNGEGTNSPFPLNGELLAHFLTINHLKYDYDIFTLTPGNSMVFKDEFFLDFKIEQNGAIVRAPDGRIVWKHSDTGAHTRHGFFRTEKDWDKYMEFNSDNPENWALVKGVMKFCKKNDIVPFFWVQYSGFFEDLCMHFGFENTFRLMIKNKEFIHKAVQQMSDFSIHVAEKVIEGGGKYLWMAVDLGYKGRSFISPKHFRDFFKPGIAKYCKRVHQLGGKVIMHADGYIMDLLPDIVDSGIDGIQPIERQAGMDIVKIRKEFPNLILIGNVPISILSHGTEKETIDYVKYLLENVSKYGNHIMGSSHSVTSNCKLENFLAYQKTVEKYGNYPIEKIEI
ncbi:MAG: uroporphyrinogen decarboxylase family protein [Promethearchaeota archaeon]